MVVMVEMVVVEWRQSRRRMYGGMRCFLIFTRNSHSLMCVS